MRRAWIFTAAAAFVLSGCASEAELAKINSIVTATETEVIGCTFLGNVDTGARATIGNARFDLKRDTAELGGTHLVETHAYAALIGFFPDFGTALSGRAYWCPPGKGPILTKPEALLKRPEENLRQYEGIHD